MSRMVWRVEVEACLGRNPGFLGGRRRMEVLGQRVVCLVEVQERGSAPALLTQLRTYDGERDRWVQTLGPSATSLLGNCKKGCMYRDPAKSQRSESSANALGPHATLHSLPLYRTAGGAAFRAQRWSDTRSITCLMQRMYPVLRKYATQNISSIGGMVRSTLNSCTAEVDRLPEHFVRWSKHLRYLISLHGNSNFCMCGRGCVALFQKPRFANEGQCMHPTICIAFNRG